MSWLIIYIIGALIIFAIGFIIINYIKSHIEFEIDIVDILGAAFWILLILAFYVLSYYFL